MKSYPSSTRPRYLSGLVLAAALFATIPAHAVDVAGVKVSEDTTLANTKLVLNGAGIRYRFVQVYVCALYLPKKADNLKDVLAVRGPKRVAVTMLRDISADDLGSALLSGIRKNSTQDETRKIGLQLVKMGEIFGAIPKLKKGDGFTVDFVPNVGTIISVNGKPVTDPIPDEAFYDALLRIWMGENPADSSLKPLLLGQKKDEASAFSN